MNLAERMKNYEIIFSQRLVPKCPAILRIDGRCFSQFTKSFKKPFDSQLQSAMKFAATSLMAEDGTFRCAYGQSDEVSFLLDDRSNFETQQWFNGKVNKICSVGSSVFTNAFNSFLSMEKKASFDARVFSIPDEDVPNYFYWRYRDAVRNSINSYAQSLFSHKQLQGLNMNEVKELIIKEGHPEWDLQPEYFKNGWLLLPTGDYTVVDQNNDIRKVITNIMDGYLNDTVETVDL